ncbi:MAG TPA: phage tail assembly chaperone [Sphingomonas sp.]
MLGWSADAFWRATPAELEAVVRVLDGSGGGEGEGGVAPPDAGAIARMREAFPDG